MNIFYIITIIAFLINDILLLKRVKKLEDYTAVKKCKKILKKALKEAKKNYEINVEKIDPTCLMHGKKMSEHTCLYCCLCYKDLTLEECNVTRDGKREDVCVSCAKREQEEMIKRGLI